MSSMNLYVGNLPYTTNENDLSDLFAQFGEVISAKVITDRYSGQSKGFGFCGNVESGRSGTSHRPTERLGSKWSSYKG